jgi:hypothetical protein
MNALTCHAFKNGQVAVPKYLNQQATTGRVILVALPPPPQGPGSESSQSEGGEGPYVARVMEVMPPEEFLFLLRGSNVQFVC